jgi:hypothetical protein
MGSPTLIVGTERMRLKLVVTVGVVLVTVKGAQVLIPMLLGSPEYAAFHDQEPNESGFAGGEDGIPLIVTVTVEVAV